MSRGQKKSDKATSADWSFMDLPGVARALERAAENTASSWHLASDAAGDLLAEAHLALAVRPEAVANSFEKGGAPYVANLARATMRNRARDEKRKIKQQAELDEPIWDEED